MLIYAEVHESTKNDTSRIKPEAGHFGRVHIMT